MEMESFPDLGIPTVLQACKSTEVSSLYGQVSQADSKDINHHVLPTSKDL